MIVEKVRAETTDLGGEGGGVERGNKARAQAELAREECRDCQNLASSMFKGPSNIMFM